MESLLTEIQVSESLQISHACLRRWRLRGEGPQYLKVGPLVRYRSGDIEIGLRGFQPAEMGAGWWPEPPQKPNWRLQHRSRFMKGDTLQVIAFMRALRAAPQGRQKLLSGL
jgi:hypothetical protein